MHHRCSNIHSLGSEYVCSVRFLLHFRQRRYYIDTLKTGQCLTCDCVLYNHATGNCLGTIHFIWKAPSSSDDPTMLVSGNATCIRKIEPSLPIYHTRTMKKHFFDQISLLRCGKPSALRGIYRLLTGVCVGGGLDFVYLTLH